MPSVASSGHATLATAEPDWLDKLTVLAGDAGENVDAALALAVEYGHRLPQPGQGDTAARWAVLAGVGAANLTVARVLEAHTDALAILGEAADASSDASVPGSWGVFAAEAPGVRLQADETGGHVTLTGTKPWCSLGDRLDHALITASVGDERRQLFQVALRRPDVHPAPAQGWVARGLRSVTSVAIDFAATPATAVGQPGWYLARPGFAWGGIGVAACWYGGAVALARTLAVTAARRPGDLLAMHAGATDVAVHAAGCTLADAAQRIDDGAATGSAGELLALRVRAVVADAVESVLRHVAHALGPTPLAFNAEHAARVADLELYVRQHHAERDLAELGRRSADPHLRMPAS